MAQALLMANDRDSIQRVRGTTHYQALRTLGNRLVDIFHGCLRTHTLYVEHLAWHTEPDKTQPGSLTASGRGMSGQIPFR
jgi:hypothetical protein